MQKQKYHLSWSFVPRNNTLQESESTECGGHRERISALGENPPSEGFYGPRWVNTIPLRFPFLLWIPISNHL